MEGGGREGERERFDEITKETRGRRGTNKCIYGKASLPKHLAVLMFPTSVLPGDLYHEPSAEYRVGSSVERLSIIEVSASVSCNEIICCWNVSLWGKWGK